MIHIFGDSFSNNSKGWPGLIGSNSVGSNGASEYRIYRTYLDRKHTIGPKDIVVFCHTHWSRIYLKDTVPSLTRKLASHPICDLVLRDVLEKNETQFIKTLESIWDEEYFKHTYQLYLHQLTTVPNSVHVTFFKDIYHPKLLNLSQIWAEHPGKINHMTDQGNSLAAEQIIQTLKRF